MPLYAPNYYKIRSALLLGLIVLLAACAGEKPSEGKQQKRTRASQPAEVLTVYTTQPLPADDSLYSAFQSNTGLKVETVEVPVKDLLPRLKEEGQRTKAGLVIFPEVGMAAEAKGAGLLQFHAMPELESYYKSMARDDHGYWTGLSRKYPAIAYAHERVKADGIVSFFDLMDSKWKGKLILPKADNPYLITLVASFIIHNGRQSTENWIKAMVANASGDAISDGKARIKALAAGQGDITLVNAGQLGQLRYPPTYQELVEGQAADLVIPANGDFHTHVNISCAAIPVGADKEMAIALIRFLVTKEVQEVYAASRHEFPVQVMAMPSSFIIEEMGGVRVDELELEQLVQYRGQAIELHHHLNWPQ